MEDLEDLKNQVLKKMEQTGVLGQLKAQMRSKIIDSQERSKENLSALYINNQKIQKAERNELAIQSINLFGEFLDFFKLENTKEIFTAETNFKQNKEVLLQLKKSFPNKEKCIGEQLLAYQRQIKEQTRHIKQQENQKKITVEQFDKGQNQIKNDKESKNQDKKNIKQMKDDLAKNSE